VRRVGLTRRARHAGRRRTRAPAPGRRRTPRGSRRPRRGGPPRGRRRRGRSAPRSRRRHRHRSGRRPASAMCTDFTSAIADFTSFSTCLADVSAYELHATAKGRTVETARATERRMRGMLSGEGRSGQRGLGWGHDRNRPVRRRLRLLHDLRTGSSATAVVPSRRGSRSISRRSTSPSRTSPPRRGGSMRPVRRQHPEPRRSRLHCGPAPGYRLLGG
jgi:hypothetical protein